MTRVAFLDAALTDVRVTVTPSWLARLLGHREHDRFFYACRSPGGGSTWVDTVTGAILDDRTLLAEIDAERKLIQWAQRRTCELVDRTVR